MTRDEAFKLLGGYATGTLTREEEQALFAAALEDQQLFDALAGEQALRDLLSDPAARGQVLAALDNPSRAWWARATHWMLRPAVAGVAAACLAVVIGYGIWHSGRGSAPAAAPTMVVANAGMEKAPVPIPTPPPAPQPVPVETSVRKAMPRTAAIPARQNDGISGVGSGGSRPVLSAAPAAPPPPVRSVEPPGESKQQQADAATQNAVLPPSQQQVVVTAQSAPIQAEQAVSQQAAPPVSQLPVQQLAVPRMGIVANLATVGPAASGLVTVAAFRRDADGTLRAVNLDMIQAGDSIVLRLTALRDGYLTVSRAGQPDEPLIPEKQVEKSKTIELPPLTLDQPGRISLTAHLTPGPLIQGARMGFRDTTTSDATSTGGGGRRRASAPEAAQAITLVFK